MGNTATVQLRDLLGQWAVTMPPAEEFWRLADATGLRLDKATGGASRPNYERGPLLYALVQHRRPKVVLEVGTGRGYGALCMARAMVDAGLDGRVFTIDRVGQQEVFPYYLDLGDGQGPRTENLSRADVWAQVAQPAWLERIEVLHGTVADTLNAWRGPRADLVFIDGDHSYDGVRHDFYSVAQHCADRVGVLFDDYSGCDDYGVARLVDDEVAPLMATTVVDNDGAWAAGALPSIGHAMAWAEGDGAPGWLREAFSKPVHQRQIARYRRSERIKGWVRRLRRALGR